MNRRDAIKKLATSGAIVAGGSVLLSTNDVAYAASPPGTELSGIPGPNEPLPVAVSAQGNGTVVITDSTTPVSLNGGAITTTYSWLIDDCNLSGGQRKFFVRNEGDTQTITSATSKKGCRDCPTPYSNPSTAHQSVRLRKNNNGGKLKPLESGDTYSIRLLITWHAAGAANSVTAEYSFSGDGTNVGQGTPHSYTIG